MKVQHDQWKISEISNRIQTRRLSSGLEYLEGVVSTPCGFVECSEWPYRNGVQAVNLRAVFDGYEYSETQYRPASKHLTKTGMARVAHLWIRELAARVS